MWPYYQRLIGDAVWRSAGTWSRVAFIATLALAVLAAVVPEVAVQIAKLDKLPRWLAVVPVAALVVWEVSRKNYDNVRALRDDVGLLQPKPPVFVFDLDDQYIMTPIPGKVIRQAHWYRVRVRNRGTVPAHGCALRLDGITGTTTGVVLGPLAVTGAGGASRDIAPDGVNEWDIGFCFETSNPVEFYISTWPQSQSVEFKNGMKVSVRFTEDHTTPALTGDYLFAQDSPGSTVWVDAETGLRSQKGANS